MIHQKKNRGHLTSKIVKSEQSYNNGHLLLLLFILLQNLAHKLMHDLTCEFFMHHLANFMLESLTSSLFHGPKWYWYCLLNSFSKKLNQGAFRISDPRSLRSWFNKKNWWIHSGHGFIGYFDAPYSEWSLISDPDPDHPKEMHLKINIGQDIFIWQYLDKCPANATA